MHNTLYTVYNRLGSGGFAVEACLALSDVPYQMYLLNSESATALPEGFRAVNPWGQVPVLECLDGTIITETAAILIHLADQHDSMRSGTHLAIGDKRAFFRWAVFLGTNVYEAALRKAYPERYVTNSPDSKAQALNGVRDAAQQRMHAAFELIEDALTETGFLTGPQLSPVDVFCAMLYAWNPSSPDLPHCAELTKIVASHPVIAPIWRRNFDHLVKRDWSRDPERRNQSVGYAGAQSAF